MLKVYNLRNNTEFKKLSSVLVDQVFMSGTTLLTTIVLARTYSKDSYADLVLLFSVTLFILGFQSAIISKPYAISLNDFKQEHVANYFNFNFNLKVLLTLGFIVVFPILFYLLFDTWESTKLFLFLLYIVSHSSYFFVRETLLSERKTKDNMYYGLVCSVCIISLLVIILIFNLTNIAIFLVAASLIYLIVALFYVVKNIRLIRMSKTSMSSYWKTNWKVGKWLLGSNFLFHISSGIYPWLLLYITSKEDIALYGVLMSIASLVNPALTALSSYLLPIFVSMNKSHKNVNSKVNKWLWPFGVMAVVLVLIGWLGGEQIISLLFGEKYDGLGFIVLYPFLIQAVTIIFQPFKVALNAIKRTDVNFWILIPRSILAVSLGYIFVTNYGLIGVFYTMLLENLFYQLSYFLSYRKIIHQKTEI